MAEPHDQHAAFAVAPTEEASWLADAVIAGGGQISSIGDAEGLIWGGGEVSELQTTVQKGVHLRWVQLPSAGVDRFRTVIDSRLTWSAAKGIFDEHVAEHALALALAGFRRVGAGARKHTWDRLDATTLFDARVCLLGAGGIATSLLRLLSPFRCSTTVIRRRHVDVSGVKTLPLSRLSEGLRDANLVVLALPLTAETEGIIAEDQLRAMRDDAWLINVGRGKLVVTRDLVRALREGWIGGAGLDVTDPEPLPVDHPLWMLENCIITPHVANPPNLERGPLSALISENVRRYLEGEPLQGVIDPGLGY
jgi:phosphoglycerate dehydrogenase-like enzyme